MERAAEVFLLCLYCLRAAALFNFRCAPLVSISPSSALFCLAAGAGACAQALRGFAPAETLSLQRQYSDNRVHWSGAFGTFCSTNTPARAMESQRQLCQ